MFGRTGEKVLLTLWVGGLWTIGFIAVPLLFSEIADKQQAGQLAGQLFTAMAVVSLLSSSLILLLWLIRRDVAKWLVAVLIAALTLTAFFLFYLIPEMNELRHAGATDSSGFAYLHRMASFVYLAISLAGLTLVVFHEHQAKVVAQQ